MEIRATTNFVHGAHTMRRGDVLDVPDVTANELTRAGLAVAVAGKKTDAEKKAEALKNSPPPENKMAADPANKSEPTRATAKK